MRNARAMGRNEMRSDELETGGKKRSIFKMFLLLFAVVLVGCAIAVIKSSHGGQIAYHISSTDLFTWAGIYLAINEHYSS